MEVTLQTQITPIGAEGAGWRKWVLARLEMALRASIKHEMAPSALTRPKTAPGALYLGAWRAIVAPSRHMTLRVANRTLRIANTTGLSTLFRDMNRL